MLTKRVIPCLDIRNGIVVKGVSFEGLREIGDPVEFAKRYEIAGADEIIMLDISATNEGRAMARDVLRRAAEQVFLPVTLGGGIHSVEDMRSALLNGADKISINSAAVSDPSLITAGAGAFGSQCIVLAIDAKRVDASAETSFDGNKQAKSTIPSGWQVFVRSGKEAVALDAVEWARRGVELGAGEILLTSINQDGQQNGYDLELIQSIAKAVPVPVIASGGVGNPQHMIDGVLRGSADAVLAASIFHDGMYSIAQVKSAMREAGIPVRLRA